MRRYDITIIPASAENLQDIADIYNHAILTSTATFDVEEKTLEDRRRWLEAHSDRHPVIVALLEEEVVGWGSLSPYAERRAYEYTVENAIYVRQDARGKGVGSALLEELVRLAAEAGYHCIIAQVVGGNEASIRLHERQQFEVVGVLKEIGWKFGGWLDVVIMERLLG